MAQNQPQTALYEEHTQTYRSLNAVRSSRMPQYHISKKKKKGKQKRNGFRRSQSASSMKILEKQYIRRCNAYNMRSQPNHRSSDCGGVLAFG